MSLGIGAHDGMGTPPVVIEMQNLRHEASFDDDPGCVDRRWAFLQPLQASQRLPESLRFARVARSCLPSTAQVTQMLVYCLAGIAFLGTFAVFFCWLVLIRLHGLAEPCATPGLHISLESRISQHAKATVPIVALLVSAPVAVWLVSVAHSHFLRQAAGFAVLNWLFGASQNLTFLGICDGEHAVFPRPMAAHMLSITGLSGLGLFAFRGHLVRQCLTALERSALERFGARRLRYTLWFFGFFSAVSLANVYHQEPDIDELQLKRMPWSFAAWWGLVNLAEHKSLVGAFALAKEAVERAPRHRMGQATQAVGAIRFQLYGSVASSLSSAVVVLTNFIIGELPTPPYGSTSRVAMEVIGALTLTLFASCNSFFVLALSGVLNGAATGAAARAAANRRRAERRSAAVDAWRTARQEEYGMVRRTLAGGRCSAVRKGLMAAWDLKVLELSGRGLSLEVLLQFWRELQSHMCHFDASKHTTADVVREVIIPYCAEQRCSCAEVLMGGQFTRPHKMVTHNWQNLFVDLMAAIVADALAELDFSMIASLLQTDLELLDRWIRKAGVGSRRYWVCAFSVNQHRSICGSNPTGTRDSVTDEPHPLCDCGLPKAWNDSPPLLPDGRSLPCEMNKFVDMMRYLSATDPAFEQVVAVDTRFNIFTRAWCIAEIAAGDEMGMIQRLKIHSGARLTQNAPRLRTLRIQDMESTRPEDKKEILDGIEDIDSFNSDLQRLLFEDLLPAWSSLDTEEQMDLAGRIIRWHKAAVWDVNMQV